MPVDAFELAELLQFLAGWLARDPGRLGASLEDFVGHPAYGTAQLRQDLDRFTFLLGGDDGESLFGPGPAGEAVTVTSPLRGPKSTEGGGFAAAHFPARRAGYGAAPPASKGASHRAARDSPAGCPGPRRPLRPLGPGRAGRPRPAPALRAARKTPRWRACASTRTRRKQMNWRPVLRRRKISGIAARP